MAQFGRASALGAEGHEFESRHSDHAGLAQWWSRGLIILWFAGSSPAPRTNMGL